MGDPWYVQYLIAVRRHEADLARAEQDHLARQVNETQEELRKPPFRAHLLNRLGVVLVNWGNSLQCRYGQAAMSGIIHR